MCAALYGIISLGFGFGLGLEVWVSFFEATHFITGKQEHLLILCVADATEK